MTTKAADRTKVGGLSVPNTATFLLAACAFFTGASGLVFEYILSTIATYVLGNSVEQFSIVIAVMLCSMGVGGYAQQFLSDDNLVEKFIGIEVVIAILGGFSPMIIYSAYAYLTPHFMLIQYAAVVGVGVLIGFEIPLLMRLNDAYSDKLGANIANIYGPDYIGSFVGAAIWVYVLFRYVPLPYVGYIMAAANFLVAFIAFSYFLAQGLIRYRYTIAITIGLTTLALGFGARYSGAWAAHAEQQLYEDRIVFQETTRYQRIVMTRDITTKEQRLYINGSLQFSSADEERYHEQLVHPAMTFANRNQDVLVLGGGDGLAVREIQKYNPDSITLVDLDPKMVELARNNKRLRAMNNGSLNKANVHYKQPKDGISQGKESAVVRATGEYKKEEGGYKRPVTKKTGEVNVYHVDADRFARRIKEQFDVIIVDLPDPSSVELAKLYSKQFYRKLRDNLRPGGVMTVQSTSPYHAEPAFLTIRRTIEAAGFSTAPYHDNVPSFGDWGWIMAKRDSRFNREKLKSEAQKLRKFPVETQYLTPDVFRSSLVFGKGMLESEDDSVNTLMHPVLMYQYIDESWKIE